MKKKFQYFRFGSHKTAAMTLLQALSVIRAKLSTCGGYRPNSSIRNLIQRGKTKNTQHIFVIGFNKTATRAISEFFSANGIPSVHWDNNKLVRRMLSNRANGKKIFTGYDNKFRVFSDLILVSDEEIVEGNQFFVQMEVDYPHSLFILNNRNTEDWITSRKLHAGGRFLKTQLKVLGTNEEEVAFNLWREQKAHHESRVRAHFAGKSNFLEIDVSRASAPRDINEFLGGRLNETLWKTVGKTEDMPKRHIGD